MPSLSYDTDTHMEPKSVERLVVLQTYILVLTSDF
jgi:hypothetical protein